ncbi:MAG: protein translocase subunit SecD, partial [Phycisphaerae bacterium]|nr:protein translocase subunit SecD [Phycisphaerae bacterium]
KYAEDAREGRILYYCSSRVEVGGENLTGAVVEPDLDRPGRYQVSFTLDRTGAWLFARVTGRNVGRQLAIILDNWVYLAPVINGRIGNGTVVINGDFDVVEATEIAIVLRAGALKVPLRIVEETTSLGGFME